MHPKVNRPIQPFLIGKAFENYVREHLFPYEQFELLEKVPEYTGDRKHFAQNALNPDYKFKDRKTGQIFFVEVKFRSRRKKCNEIRWTYPAQLYRYLSFNRCTPTFVLLGVGGSPESPELTALIPVEQAQYTSLFIKTIKRFNIAPTTAVRSEMLRSF
jgi:hypothetical protein